MKKIIETNNRNQAGDRNKAGDRNLGTFRLQSESNYPYYLITFL
jgi:hypothetical protein